MFREGWKSKRYKNKKNKKIKNKKKKSYETLLQHHKDPSVVIKFQFFQDLVNLVLVFLKDFQTDNPVLPILSDMLDNLSCRLL